MLGVPAKMLVPQAVPKFETQVPNVAEVTPASCKAQTQAYTSVLMKELLKLSCPSTNMTTRFQGLKLFTPYTEDNQVEKRPT